MLLFATIKENLQYENIDATEDDMSTAISMANAAEFIWNSEKGLDSDVRNLSKSQKLRIAIARALIKKPELLVLDDITSGLEFFDASTI